MRWLLLEVEYGMKTFSEVKDLSNASHDAGFKRDDPIKQQGLPRH